MLVFIDAVLFVLAFAQIPPQRLPWFYYPVLPVEEDPERQPDYTNDCWGVEANYCWWYQYETRKD